MDNHGDRCMFHCCNKPAAEQWLMIMPSSNKDLYKEEIIHYYCDSHGLNGEGRKFNFLQNLRRKPTILIVG